ncbi:hypothetical protein [Cognatilysobacter segetis]|uniref:hypothetical protein n=1 Tax=Cognatilysobacter segetis TaxID=2492394 RepID=UPI00105D4956|nr:hypothetical protein [Lysobacter segetis]
MRRHAPSPVPIALPYAFDTRRTTVLVLQGVLALLAVLLAGGVFVLVVRHDARGAAGLLPVVAMLGVFARVLLRAMPGAEGRITADAVEARARRVWGLALPGPVGRFALADFEAVRVERRLVSGSGTALLGPLERVTLAGRPGTPDIAVLEAHVDGAASPGEALAAALRLPCEVVRAPLRARWGVARPRGDGR